MLWQPSLSTPQHTDHGDPNDNVGRIHGFHSGPRGQQAAGLLVLVALAVHLTETSHADGKPERPAPCRHAVVVAVSHLCEVFPPHFLSASGTAPGRRAQKEPKKWCVCVYGGQGSASSAYVHPLCNWRSTISFLRPQRQPQTGFCPNPKTLVCPVPIHK